MPPLRRYIVGTMRPRVATRTKRALMTPAIPPQLRDSYISTETIDHSDLAFERILHHSKWFDYRFMSPRAATLEFKAIYEDIFETNSVRICSPPEAARAKGVSSGAYEATTEWPAFWRARQRADLLSLPYKVYLIAAFNYLLDHGSKRMSYINQLYDERYRTYLLVAASHHWRDFRTSRLVFSPLAQYREEHFANLPAQIVHRRWVADELKTKSKRELGNACFLERILPVDEAISAFGSDYVEAARAEVKGEPSVPVEPLPDGALMRSCQALAAAYEPGSIECGSCEAYRACSAQVIDVRQRLLASSEPRDVRRSQASAAFYP
jgi:hypothetical protein